jgi:hypothetical protein
MKLHRIGTTSEAFVGSGTKKTVLQFSAIITSCQPDIYATTSTKKLGFAHLWDSNVKHDKSACIVD